MEPTPKTPPEDHPPVACWSCGARQPLAAILDDAIIISRSPRDGGPYYLSICPGCLAEGMVEETPRGRWFCSPNVRVGLLDYLFAPSDSGDTQSKLILRAISWLRDNEERRKYFFERDGDARYSGVSLLRKLWPWGRVTQTAATGETTAGAGSDGDTGTRERAGGRQDRTERPPRTPQPTTPRIVTPHEILGVPPDATVDVITQRFHRLAVQYHPDKVHHLGEEFREVAHVKFVELQRAYRSLVDEARRKK